MRKRPACGLCLLATVLIGSGLPAATPATTDGSTVAADGSGQFKTVQEAINAAPQTSSAPSPWTIHILPGTYHEIVYVQREKHFVRLIGDDPLRTTITYELCASMPGRDGKPIGTFHTPTVWIDADDFTVENLTLANAAGPVGQALACRVDGERVSFRNCRFTGWQDTILANRGRQYFEGCTIRGATDFIFGGSTAYFKACTIECAGNGYITAASTPAGQAYGFVFSGCRIVGDPGVKTYLGRPWRDHANVMFLGTEMSGVVRAEGWHNWNKPEREKTARFAESGSTGPGAQPSSRVPWARPLAESEAAAITVDRVLAGAEGWKPEH